MIRPRTYYIHLIENGGCSSVRDIPLGVYEANSWEAAETQARHEWSVGNADLEIVPMGEDIAPPDPRQRAREGDRP